MTGLEPIVAAFAGSMASVAAEIVAESSGGLLERLRRSVGAEFQQRLFDASHRYIQHYKKRHCQLKVLGMHEPISLETVYTTAKFLSDQEILNFESIESLEQAYRSSRLRGYQLDSGQCQRQPGLKIANDTQYLMVLGGPGAGKSTFLRKTGLEALKSCHYMKTSYEHLKFPDFYKHLCIPVFIELKRLDTVEIDLEAFIATEFATCGFPDAQRFTRRALDQGRLLILLDGLDEVPSDNLNEAISTIQDFVDRYDKNRFIVSCRTAAYRSGFKRFRDVAMSDFDNEQIRQFLANWFGSEHDKAQKTAKNCWTLLQKPENSAAKELAHTPLLLTFLCLVYNRAQTFPDNRSLLYGKALRILLEEWASEKRILRTEIYEGLSTELEEVLLSEIAYQNFKVNQLFFSRRALVESVKGFLASNLNAPKHLDGEAVVDAIEVQQGILVERAENAYSFSHLTLQEYLAAQYVLDHGLWEELIQQHLLDNRWREVFLLIPGLMRWGADNFLSAMECQANGYLQSPILQSLLRWADDITASAASHYRPAEKRCAAIFLARSLSASLNPDQEGALDHARGLVLPPDFDLARVRDLDLAHVRALGQDLDHARALDRDRAYQYASLRIFETVDFPNLIQGLEALKECVPGANAARAERQAFTQHLNQLWMQALALNPAWVNLSAADVQALTNYFHAHELIARCKEAAVRVSPTVWAKIEAAILTVPPKTQRPEPVYASVRPVLNLITP
ncbi:MAG: NACHT domain-containing protein [Cyanobacteria bacterium P01_D01_bin.44]